MSSMLSERISNAQNVEDLLPILNALPIDTLNDIVSNAINNLTPNVRRSIQLRSCSIHKVIGHDVMQNILSFIPYSGAILCIDKTFKAISAKNAAIRLKKRNEFINADNFETDFEKKVESIFDLHSINNKDIFDLESPKQILLTKREILSDYVDNKKVYHSFKDIFNDANNKRIIFVEDGEYKLLEDGRDWQSENVIIGIGSNVRIVLQPGSPDMDFRFACHNIYIENVTINPSKCGTHILLTENSNLRIKNSVINQMAIHIEDAEFYAKKCTFVNTIANCGFYSVIKRHNVADSRNFSVLGCTFDVKKQYVTDSIIEIEADDLNEMLVIAGNIKINGNMFDGECRSTIPVGANVRSCRNAAKKKICFPDNKTIEHNIIVGNITNRNPNQIHKLCPVRRPIIFCSKIFK